MHDDDHDDDNEDADYDDAIKGSLQKNGTNCDFVPARGGAGSDRIPTLWQNFPKPNFPWNCPEM